MEGKDSILAVRRAKLAGTVSWADGTPFDGFAVFTLNAPTAGSVWPSVSLGAGTYPRVDLPIRFPVPIVKGQFDQTASLPYSADVNPPNTRYAANYYDSAWVQIAGPTAVFQVTADPTTPTIPTLTAPTAPVAQNVTLET